MSIKNEVDGLYKASKVLDWRDLRYGDFGAKFSDENVGPLVSFYF